MRLARPTAAGLCAMPNSPPPGRDLGQDAPLELTAQAVLELPGARMCSTAPTRTPAARFVFHHPVLDEAQLPA